MVLVDKLFGRLSSFSFQLKCSSIIFKFDLPLSVRKEPLITGSVILLISQSIDSMQLKCKGCLPPIGNNKQCCLSIKGFIGKCGTRFLGVFTIFTSETINSTYGRTNSSFYLKDTTDFINFIEKKFFRKK